MTVIRVVTAIGVTAGLIYLYPVMHDLMSILTDMATSMFPGLTAMDTTFLAVAPMIALGAIIWGGITYAIGKMHGGDI